MRGTTPISCRNLNLATTRAPFLHAILLCESPAFKTCALLLRHEIGSLDLLKNPHIRSLCVGCENTLRAVEHCGIDYEFRRLIGGVPRGGGEFYSCESGDVLGGVIQEHGFVCHFTNIKTAAKKISACQAASVI
jgi:hypothetical protein